MSVHRHVCMMEGFDPELSLSTDISNERDRAKAEIDRLRALLTKNNIDFRKPNNTGTITTTAAQTTQDEPSLPVLPHEILLIILDYAVTSSAPLTDPMYKGRSGNMTPDEKTARGQINVNFLATSKIFRREGITRMIKNNEIIFTQAIALANFVRCPLQLRDEIDHITLRVVGRYYGEKAIEKFDLSGEESYHPMVPKIEIPLLAHPDGMNPNQDPAIRAYCFSQLADFLKALSLPNTANGKVRRPLFANLKTMRIDLVNFCDRLTFGSLFLAPALRWHCPFTIEEILVTGFPNLDTDGYDEMEDEVCVLKNLLKLGGLFSQAGPRFISVKDGVKPLPGYKIRHSLARPDEYNREQFQEHHPEGGKPPVSQPSRDYVFKWALLDFQATKKQWLEFDYETGKQQLECEQDPDYIHSVCDECGEDEESCECHVCIFCGEDEESCECNVCLFCGDPEERCECNICVDCGDLNCTVCCLGNPYYCNCERCVEYRRVEEEYEA